METHLFELIGDAWFTYSDRVKAVLRLVACAKHGGTPLHKLCEHSNFDVKLRWMIGLPADMEGIGVWWTPWSRQLEGEFGRGG